MRFWLSVIIVLLLSIVAVVLAHLYLAAPIYLEYQGWSANPPMSVVLGILLLLIVMLLLVFRILAFFVFLPKRLSEWREAQAEKKQRQYLQDTMRLSAYQEWHELLKVLSNLARSDSVAAWRAAQTADMVGDSALRDKMLNRASTSDNATIAAVAKATICLHNKRLTEADTILTSVKALRGPIVLTETYYAIGKARDDWEIALQAAVSLRDRLPGQWAAAVDEAVRRLLETADSVKTAKSIWQTQVPSGDRKRPPLIALYLLSLARLGDEKSAEEGLSHALKQHPQDDDILDVVIAIGNRAHYEKALQDNEERAQSNQVRVLRILAALTEHLGLLGKARHYYGKLNAMEPHSQYRRALSNLPEA